MRTKLALSLADQVLRGLSDPAQKWLPAATLYDDVGSALFEAITALPEYGLTRADVRLLGAHSRDIAVLTGANMIVELGSGSGVKTRRLLSAFPPGIVYSPVDVSRAALDRCTAELAGFTVRPVQEEFGPGLLSAVAGRGPEPVLVAFLGSNIGNFERHEIVPFLTGLRSELRRGDAFLLGADLMKPVEDLLLAYDDPAGVTAAFNRNLLARLNRECGGNFNVRCFDHEARWDADSRRIEMHLRARSPQQVSLSRLQLELTMEAGETIWTESSHKFEVSELIGMGSAAGFTTAAVWTDSEWPFAELLFRAM
jgi:dimethylhistidine N-methyltransferase